MKSTFFDEKTKKDSLGYFGGSLFASICFPMIGSSILGTSFGLSFLLGGCIFVLPHLALQLYLDQLLKTKKLSQREHNVCSTVFFFGIIASSAALGAVMMGNAILPAIIASGVGLGVMAAILSIVYLVNQLQKPSQAASLKNASFHS